MTSNVLRLSVFSVLLALSAVFLGSCNKFKGDQTIPAYIRIDSIYVYTDYENQGAPTSNITDAWVYINNEAIGAYELPAVFPVLAKGLTEVRVDEGAKVSHYIVQTSNDQAIQVNNTEVFQQANSTYPRTNTHGDKLSPGPPDIQRHVRTTTPLAVPGLHPHG